MLSTILSLLVMVSTLLVSVQQNPNVSPEFQAQVQTMAVQAISEAQAYLVAHPEELATSTPVVATSTPVVEQIPVVTPQQTDPETGSATVAVPEQKVAVAPECQLSIIPDVGYKKIWWKFTDGSTSNLVSDYKYDRGSTEYGTATLFSLPSVGKVFTGKKMPSSSDIWGYVILPNMVRTEGTDPNIVTYTLTVTKNGLSAICTATTNIQ